MVQKSVDWIVPLLGSFSLILMQQIVENVEAVGKHIDNTSFIDWTAQISAFFILVITIIRTIDYTLTFYHKWKPKKTTVKKQKPKPPLPS